MSLEEKVVRIAKGNIGVLTVLIEIAKKDPIFLNPLEIAMSLTNSESYGIWLVCKDICKNDIEETMRTLRSWFDNSTIPLEKWLEQKGIR